MNWDFEECAAEVCDTTVNQLYKGGDRKRENVYARTLCFWYLRQNTSWSLAKIGNRYNRHHATVMHGIRSITSLLSVNDKFSTDLVHRFNNRLEDDSSNIGGPIPDILKIEFSDHDKKVICFMHDNAISTVAIAQFYRVKYKNIKNVLAENKKKKRKNDNN